MRFKQFHIPVYYGSLVIAQGNFSKICKKFNLDIDQLDLDSKTGAATVILEDDGEVEYFMFFRKEVDWREVAHECLHFVNRLFHDRGVELDPTNDEPQAYFLSWTISRCSETLKKIKKPLVLMDYEVK